MISKIIKYILTFIIALSLGSELVFANEKNYIVDFDSKGSIEIVLTELTEETPIEGAEITLYHVANAYSDNARLGLKFVPELSECEVDLTNLEDSDLVNKITSCLIDKEVNSYKKISNENGIVKFDDLTLGLYYVKQTNKVNGYSQFDPFLAMMPMEEDGGWIYDVKANPKTDIIRLFDLTIEKRWNAPKDEVLPREVEIELYKDNELVDSVILSELNNWTYTFEQIEESKNYSVVEKNVPKGYTAIYQGEYDNFVVINAKKLVQTGFNTYIPFMFVCMGITSLLVGVVMCKRDKYE